jgi:sulfite exporter TauE/SafE
VARGGLLFNAGRIASYGDAGGIAGAMGSVALLLGPAHTGAHGAFVAAQV